MSSVQKTASIGPFDQPSRSTSPPPLNLDDLRILNIIFKGWNPEIVFRLMRLMFEIGNEYHRGAESMRDVAKALEARSFQKKYPPNLPYGASSLSIACHLAEDFFGEKFQFGSLFVAEKNTFTSLTTDGDRAWEFARDFVAVCGLPQ